MTDMSDMALLVLILIFLEMFEALWQRADNMMSVLKNGYHYYQKSIFLFLLMHPSFYYILFVSLLTNILNGWIVAILLFKTIDIFLKIVLMQNIFVKGEIDEDMLPFLEERVTPWIFLMGLGLYPPLLIYALI
jgi:hypothetical protein